LEVGAGEFFTLLGPSGSGKTTSLMLWAGFVVPTAGRVMISGRDVSRVPPHHRNLGMVFQHYALFPHMTVAGNVAFPLEMRRWGRSKIRNRVAELLELVQLGPFEQRVPRHLSGGQQQRVALARALAALPPAVLMDEPLGALDRKLREEMQTEFRRLHRETGTTIVYVTHDQGEALTLSNRIAVMHDGRVEQIGTPADLYERPATRFVAGFLGEANFFEGEVIGEEGGTIVAVTAAGVRLRVTGRKVHGERVLIAIRPEAMRISTDQETAPTSANAVRGTLIDSTYGGPVVRYRVAVPGTGDLSAAMPSADAPTISWGSPVQLWWQVSRGRFVGP